MKIRLSYTTKQEHIKYAPTPFDGVVIVPDDCDIPNTESDEFEFELVYNDYEITCVYYIDSPPNWQRFLPCKRRDYLISRGCTCHNSYVNRNLCSSCLAVCREEYHTYIEKEKTIDLTTKRDYIHVPQRSYSWKQIGGPRIHWCYYEVDRATYTEYNFGEIILEQLNNECIKKAINITNPDGENIISGCLLLRRQDADDGSIPPYEGNTVINGMEYTNAQVFY
jgi:hypothetical protein